MSLLLLVVATGFLGSFHCAAMCGPLLSACSLDGRTGFGWRHAAYQLGRLTAYVSLGAVAGMLGQSYFYLGSMMRAQKILMVAMGVTLILVGLGHLTGKRPRFLIRWQAGVTRGLAAFRGTATEPAGAGLLGLVSALLPCGFLYSFALVAAASGHPFSALVIMAGFWLGTLPALLCVGWLSRVASASVRASMRQWVSVALVVFGLLALAGKWAVLPGQASPLGPLCGLPPG